MGISFGNKNVKPYVGSKEVKEAYVGNTLVYKTGLGDKYAFLGNPDGYYLADWCILEQNAQIKVESNSNRILLSRVNYAPGKLKITEIKGNTLKLKAKLGIYQAVVSISYTLNGTTHSVGLEGFNTSAYNEATWNVIPGITEFSIVAQASSYNGSMAYLDDIRFE